MDMNYNILKLEEILRKTIQNCLASKKDIKYIIRDWLDEKEPYLLDEKELGELKKYSSSSVRLTLEKMILVSLESKEYKESHWQALKERGEKSRSFMLSHYFDSLIDDIKKNIYNYDKNNNIEEIEKFYNEQIKDSFQIFGDSINHVIENTKSISLNHMNNLHANGRTISLKENDSFKRIGGIFLSKESKIGYANFVNKKDLLKNFKTSANQKEIKLKNGTIRIYDFKRIVNSLTQTLTIKSNSNIKNQDARLIMENDKKVGSIFLGKNGIDLENGTYISVEELSFALNQYLKEKNSMNEQPKKVIKRKGKIKQAVASVALATSLLSTLTLPTGEAKEDTTIISEQKLEENKEYSSTNKITLNSLELKQAIPNDNLEISKLYEDSNDSSIAEVFQQTSLENINVEKQEEVQIEKEEITETTNEIVEEKPDKQLDEVVEEEQTEVLNEVKEVKEEQTHIEESIEVEEKAADLDEEIKEEQTEILNEIVEDKEKQREVLNEIEEEKEEDLEKTTSKEKEEDTIEETNQQNVPKEELLFIEKDETLEESKKVDTSLNEPISYSTIQEDNLKNTINGQDIVDYAVQFVGNPYEYGGDSLTEGTDCSGFTKGIYSHFGIELPRTSKEQRSIGTSVGKNLENALPGDLICYNGHVAIYVGDGQIVHASTEKTGIKIGKADYKDVVTIQRIIEPQIEKEESKVK